MEQTRSATENEDSHPFASGLCVSGLRVWFEGSGVQGLGPSSSKTLKEDSLDDLGDPIRSVGSLVEESRKMLGCCGSGM